MSLPIVDRSPNLLKVVLRTPSATNRSFTNNRPAWRVWISDFRLPISDLLNGPKVWGPKDRKTAAFSRGPCISSSGLLSQQILPIILYAYCHVLTKVDNFFFPFNYLLFGQRPTTAWEASPSPKLRSESDIYRRTFSLSEREGAVLYTLIGLIVLPLQL